MLFGTNSIAMAMYLWRQLIHADKIQRCMDGVSIRDIKERSLLMCVLKIASTLCFEFLTIGLKMKKIAAKKSHTAKQSYIISISSVFNRLFLSLFLPCHRFFVSHLHFDGFRFVVVVVILPINFLNVSIIWIKYSRRVIFTSQYFDSIKTVV